MSLSTDDGMGGDAKTGSEISGRDEGAGDAGGLSKIDGGGVRDGGVGGVGGISEKDRTENRKSTVHNTRIGDGRHILTIVIIKRAQLLKIAPRRLLVVQVQLCQATFFFW